MTASAPTNLKTFEDTVYTWFRGQTGLTNVRWADQDHPQFVYPFGLITPLTGMSRVANGFDETLPATNLANASGEEVELTYRGWREMTVSFQVWVGPPYNNDPLKNARDYLARAQGSLNFESVQSMFQAANIAVINDFGIVKLDRNIEDAFISIASMDVRFMLVSQVVEKTGYIKTLEVDGDIKNIDGNAAEITVDVIYGDT